MTPYRFLPLLLLLFPIPAPAAAEDCLECHRQTTPAAVRAWEKSAHAPAVACSDCHGRDHEAMRAGTATVTVTACAPCHPRAAGEHRASRHGMGLHSGWGCTRNAPDRDPAECRFCHEKGSAAPLSTVQCARFLTQTPEMRQIGCNRCHQVENSCASCHGAHTTDPAIVRAPQVCAKCHMGPDHPQWEMWQTSQHGALASTGTGLGPDCQRCHMPGGSHDVSRGITATPGLKILPDAGARREEMLGICGECHARGFSIRDLERADAVRDQALALVAEAEDILRALDDEGLLDPGPGERPPHPLRGTELVTDGQMLYEDISHAERIFFKMKKYDLAKTVKGAYHQNPAYTHWYGNAELKMDLVDLRAEASRLRQRQPGAGEQAGAAGSAPATGTRLEILRRQFDRGELEESEYRDARQQALDKYLEGRRH